MAKLNKKFTTEEALAMILVSSSSDSGDSEYDSGREEMFAAGQDDILDQ